LNLRPVPGLKTLLLAAVALAAAAGPAGAATQPVAGTVTAAGSGDALGGICVSVYPLTAADAMDATPIASATTAADGTYALNVETGPVKMGFSDCTNHHYATQFLNQKPDLDGADLVPIFASTTPLQKDAVLTVGAGVSGTVFDGATDDTPLEKACVAALKPSGGVIDVTTTAADGTYRLGGLPDGTYRIRFLTAGCPLVPAQRFAAQEHVPQLTVAGDETSGIDAHLLRDEVAPVTRILGGPAALTGDDAPSFSFTSNEDDSTFVCTVDGETAPCQSPWTPATSSGIGGHTFSVSATDSAGNAGDPAVRVWAYSPGAPVVTQGPANPGGTVSSDTAGAGTSFLEPVVAALTTPVAGDVTFRISTGLTTAVGSAWKLFGRQITITAPPSTAADPLRLVFTIDGAVIPDETVPELITVFRDGTKVDPCAGDPGTASPDPCIAQTRSLVGGKAEITVLSSHASVWNFGVDKPADKPADPPPANGGAGGGGAGGTSGGGGATGGTTPAAGAGGGLDTINAILNGIIANGVVGGGVLPTLGTGGGGASTTQAGGAATAKKCRPPTLKNHTLAGARRLAKQAGCAIGTVASRKKAGVRPGRVFSQSARPGRVSPAGRRINIVLGA
jgi:hypothetical protein